MGAENSVLEGCEWGDEVNADSLDWDLQHAETKDGRAITVFQPQKSERKYRDMIQQLAKSLKTLRHPSILRYVGAGKTSEGCFLVTEQATPLASVLDKLSPLEVCAGLSDVLDALMFLHDKVGITHNNIGVGAVFVAKDGGWRLGELQHACPFASATSEFLDACRAYRDQAALSPEEKQGAVEVKSGQGHARDMFALGVFIEQLCETLTELGEFSKTFEQRVGACMAADPTQRPSVLELKNDSLFQLNIGNDFIQILNFVRNIALKTAEEKTEFFSGLLPRLLALPEELVARRLAIPLLSRFVLLDETAVAHVVPHLLTPKTDDTSGAGRPGLTPVLSGELFKAHIIPELQHIFLVHDAHIRLVLLQYFSHYVHLFEHDKLQGEIFPQILLGLRDTSDAIVASSLRALADLVPLLGGDAVIGGQRKTFFFHGMPKFSPNREKDERASSVTDMMRSVKSSGSLSLANGKPLLKDLAALASGSAAKPNRDPAEQERKRIERERRREEARQRKEERQRKLKLQQLEMENENQKGESTGTDFSSRIISDTHEKVSDKLDSDQDDKDNSKLHSKLGGSDEGSDKIVYVDDENSNDNKTSLEEEKFASEESEEEWEDWEDNGSGSVIKSQDDAINEEIEAELVRMSGNANHPESSKKIPTSPDPYRHGSPAEIDSPFDSVVSSPEHSNPHFTANQQKVSGQSPSRADSKQTSSKGLKLVAKNKTATSALAKTASAKTAQAKKPAVSDDLGLGYDIKSLELTVVKEEMDFFADMTPAIKPSADKGLGVSSIVESRKDLTSTEVEQGLVTSSLFAMTAAEGEEEAGGWGETDDWGVDDF